MLKASPPPRFNIAFASGAGGGFIRPIPQASQIGVQGGAASLTDGFPPLNFQPVAAGGIPPFGEDFNGILNQMSLWCQWLEAGAPIYYDSTFASGGSGGYPQGAVVQSALVAGNYWLNTVDGNTTDPDSTAAANWINPPGLMGTGALGYTVFTTLPNGWVWAQNSYTIGNAASGASYANANALFLYTALWNGFSNSICPVTGGRGANAAADFAAGKPIQVLDVAGAGIIGADNSTGRLTGVPVVNGSISVPGSTIGEDFHTLSLAEIAAGITSSGSNSISVTGSSADGQWDRGVAATTTGGGAFGVNSVTAQGVVGFNSTGTNTISVTSSNTGGGSHNNVERSLVVKWMLKL